MNPVFEKVIYPQEHSIRMFIQRLPYLQSPWHFHPDIELALITKGHGKRYVGDHVENFSEGDLVLIESNLPHVCLSDQVFYSNNSDLIKESIVIQINKEYFMQNLLQLPEMKALGKLVEMIRFGLKIESRKDLIDDIYRLVNMKGISRIAHLLLLLEKISQSTDIKPLASSWFVESLTPPTNQRVHRIFNFLMKNYLRQIAIGEAATIAQMNPTAFCRFFKLHTGKTFSCFYWNCAWDMPANY